MYGGSVGNTANYCAVPSPNSAIIESNDRLKSTLMLEDSVNLFSVKNTAFFLLGSNVVHSGTTHSP
jgi:hypothetical protein